MQYKEPKFYNPNALCEDYSPSLPSDFPSELIPENICEVEYLKLLTCGQNYSFVMQCSDEYEGYLRCKK